MEDLTPLQAFRRICNLRMLAGVYYFCLLHALARTLGWFDELELVRHYLAILQMRMGERLSFDMAAPPELLSAHLPTLVLPTLVENAIKHGLSPLPEGGRILIRAMPADGGGLSIEVADDGQGLGAANTRARLAARFGDAASLELEAALPRGVIARVKLPAEALVNVNAVASVSRDFRGRMIRA